MKVKNLNGTSDRDCKCSSWLEHWRKSAGSGFANRKICANQNCKNNATVGGHVIKANSIIQRHYIVPLCYTCNHPSNTGVMDIGDVHLALANVRESCARW